MMESVIDDDNCGHYWHVKAEIMTTTISVGSVLNTTKKTYNTQLKPIGI